MQFYNFARSAMPEELCQNQLPLQNYYLKNHDKVSE